MRRETRGQGLPGNLRGRRKELVMAVQRSAMGDPYFETPGLTLLALVTVPDSTAVTGVNQSAATTEVIPTDPITMVSGTAATGVTGSRATAFAVLSLVVISATWATYH